MLYAERRNNILKQRYLNKLDNKFASKRNRFSSILQLTVLNSEWNNFIVSNSTADLGKDVKAVDNRYVTIQNNVKNLQQKQSAHSTKDQQLLRGSLLEKVLSLFVTR